MPQNDTVFLIDDDPSVLRATSRLVRSAGWDVVAFDSPASFLRQQNPGTPGCLILDLTMPEIDGLALQEILAQDANLLPVIFLTGTGDVSTAVRAMKSGAVDFLNKPCPDELLIAAIRVALNRDKKSRKRRAQKRELLNRLALLTPREHEVMLGVVSGKMNKQIASDLGAAEKTIKVHRGRVMEKLQIRSLAELVRFVERALAE